MIVNKFINCYTNMRKIVFLSILLIVGCTSEVEKEFSKINEKNIVLDRFCEIRSDYGSKTTLEKGVYKPEVNSESKYEYIVFESLSTGERSLLNYEEYKYVKDICSFHLANESDITKALAEKEERSVIHSAKSVDLGIMILVVGESYEGDRIMSAVDRSDRKAKYSPDETIQFKREDRYYFMVTQKMNYGGYPAMYRINFLYYKGLPWKSSDFE